jgi:hypothetical protein
MEGTIPTIPTIGKGHKLNKTSASSADSGAHILAEDGSILTTESGDHIVQE